MEDLKAGDIIWFGKNDYMMRGEVIARVDKIVFTRILYPNGSLGPLTGPHMIEDLITYGFKKEA